MSKQPSPEREIRNLKRDVKHWKRQAAFDASRADTAIRLQGVNFQRAVLAESEIEKWKRRFDLLLARTPSALPEDGR